jgi:hypothetical protein
MLLLAVEVHTNELITAKAHPIKADAKNIMQNLTKNCKIAVVGVYDDSDKPNIVL